MGRQLPDDELLEDAGDAAFRDPEQRGLHQQARIPIARRIVGIGDTAGDKRPEDCRVVRRILLVMVPASVRFAVKNCNAKGAASCVMDAQVPASSSRSGPQHSE